MITAKNKKLLSLVTVLFVGIFAINYIQAQDLESNNYIILDPTVDSGGGLSTGSSGYDLLTSAGQTGADTRLESSSYAARTGFPNGIQANVPLINCFETSSDSISTDCTQLPNANGLDGECGDSGCYDRAKIEVDNQNNPIDTLYLVALSKDSFATTLYLQDDHSVGSTFDINDYMTLCELQGRDDNNPDCDDSGDVAWNENLQSYNIYTLEPDTTYEIAVRAVSGDFTETQFSPTSSATTTLPTISFDVDVAATDTETAPVHSIAFGTIGTNITTATEKIWLDIGSNSVNGINVYVNNLGQGLYSPVTTESIPSESEDLTVSDGDGGYGLKNLSTNQTSLGPLLQGSTYDTIGADEVGGMNASATLILYTDTTGTNRGQIFEGRSETSVKVKSYSTLSAGSYSDTITFTVLGNW